MGRGAHARGVEEATRCGLEEARWVEEATRRWLEEARCGGSRTQVVGAQGRR